MRRVIAIILAVFITGGIYAQSPKAVFKGLEENDIAKNTARFEKISNKTREKMPEMCYLAEAALLNMPKQLGTNKLRGYEILSEHIEDIRNSANIEKSFHNLDITLDDIIRNIENESSNYLMTLDTERDYVIYISWAKRGGHPNISQIESRLEDLRYTHTLAANSSRSIETPLTSIAPRFTTPRLLRVMTRELLSDLSPTTLLIRIRQRPSTIFSRCATIASFRRAQTT